MAADLKQHVMGGGGGVLAVAPSPPRRLEILPENRAAVQLFAALSTQWRFGGMTGIRTGLDYAAIPATAGMLGLETSADLMQRLQTIEYEVLRLDKEARRDR